MDSVCGVGVDAFMGAGKTIACFRRGLTDAPANLSMTRGQRVRLEVRDIEGEMDLQVLDTSVIVDGINRICRGGLLAKESERSIQQAAELQVAGLINPYLADYVVQAGLFGAIAYP